MKLHNIAIAMDLEKQNEILAEGNEKLKHILYHRKFISNPVAPERRED